MAHDTSENAATSSRCTCTRNSKTLLWVIALSGTISTTQLVAAVMSGSSALLVDSMSMLVDCITYVGNLCADGYPWAELAASGVSLAILGGVSLWGVIDSALVFGTNADDNKEDTLVAEIVLGFGIWGFFFDCFAMLAFYRFGPNALMPTTSSGSSEEGNALCLERESPVSSGRIGADAPPCFQEKGQDASGHMQKASSTAPPEPEEASINMKSAFLHVASDFLRSFTTIIEGSLVIWAGIDGRGADAVATLVVSSTIVLGTCGFGASWYRQLKAFWAAQDQGANGMGLRASDESPNIVGAQQAQNGALADAVSSDLDLDSRSLDSDPTEGVQLSA